MYCKDRRTKAGKKNSFWGSTNTTFLLLAMLLVMFYHCPDPVGKQAHQCGLSLDLVPRKQHCLGRLLSL